MAHRVNRNTVHFVPMRRITGVVAAGLICLGAAPQDDGFRSLFDGRVTFDGTVYDRYTRNQIFNVTISPASGFYSKAINAGRLSNKGVEALVSVIPNCLRTGTPSRWRCRSSPVTSPT